MTKGWTAPELEQVLDRALALCDTVGDDTHRAQTLYGLQSLYVVQARLELVQMVSDELQTLYQRSLGTAPPPLAVMMLAGARMHLGKSPRPIHSFHISYQHMIQINSSNFRSRRDRTMQLTRERGKHMPSGAWAIHKRRLFEGLTR